MNDTAFPARLLVVADLDYVGGEARWLALIEEVAAVLAALAPGVQVLFASGADGSVGK